MTERLPITFGVKRKYIRVGSWEADDIYYNIRSEERLHVKNRILEANGIDISGVTVNENIGYKEMHQAVIPYLGPSFNRYFSRLNCEYWIDQYRPVFDKACFYSTPYRFWFDTRQVVRFWNCREVALRTYDEANYNLLPFVVYFGTTPQHLKALLGKSIWRRITENSLTTNKNIIQLFLLNDDHTGEVDRPSESRLRTKPMRDSRILDYRIPLETYCQLKSSLVKNALLLIRPHEVLDSEQLHFLRWANSHCRVSKIRDIESAHKLVKDTRNMAIHNNMPFDSNWSRSRISCEYAKFRAL